MEQIKWIIASSNIKALTALSLEKFIEFFFKVNAVTLMEDGPYSDSSVQTVEKPKTCAPDTKVCVTVDKGNRP